MVRGKDSPAAPRALKREETRRALIDAAFAIAEPGGDPIDPAAFAAEAGVSRPLFYRHFATRGDYVDAVLMALHAGLGPDASSADARHETAEERILGFFETLATPLDRRARLARSLIPASHLPGPVAEARAKRRERAIERLAAMLPEGVSRREARAAFLMDAFLGIQLAWSKAADGESLLDRVKSDMPWAVAGASIPDPVSPNRPVTDNDTDKKERES